MPESGAAGAAPARTLVAVFASPVAEHLLRYGRDLGFRTVLVEPETALRIGTPHADLVTAAPLESFVDGTADVVVTDHDRPELGHGQEAEGDAAVGQVEDEEGLGHHGQPVADLGQQLTAEEQAQVAGAEGLEGGGLSGSRLPHPHYFS